MNKKLSFALQAVVVLVALLSITFSVSAMTETGKTQNIVTGKVMETMNSGGYTYMLIEYAAKDTRWVAIPESTVEKGATVRFYEGMVMKNFTSKTLGRVFETIVFSPGLANNNATSPHATFHKTEDSFTAAIETEQDKERPQTTPNRSGGSLGAIVPFEDLSIRKAEGKDSYTIAEIFTNGRNLDGKTVVIRGKVMKISSKIMGRNWIHIQDGTGNAMKNQHDLVITTQDKAEKGDIVIVKGILAADKDFGAGYHYEVLVENAKISKE